MTEKIILHSNHCPKCNILAEKLNAANIPYTEVTDIEEMLAEGFMSMPVLEVDGEIMLFTEANAWVNERNKDEY